MLHRMSASRSTLSTACCPSSERTRPRSTRQFVALFKALGDPTRLEVVGLLSARGTELCVCDIEAHFKLSQPTVSHHLRLLREAGVVRSERRGTWVYYALRHEVMKQLEEFRTLLRR